MCKTLWIESKYTTVCVHRNECPLVKQCDSLMFLDNTGALCHKRSHIRLWIQTQYNDQFTVGFNGICSHNKTSIVNSINIFQLCV